ncbi:MAG TPA: DUF4397 domain-containing protein [Gemmataceae bacterium]|nr:DUF4397 domain-containing protein [Gemmataceae bacterium]
MSVHASARLRLEALDVRDVPAAGLQVIHNSPYPAAAVVDVYVNDTRVLDDFAFRSATPFLDVPAGTPLKIDVVAAAAATNANPVFTATATLADGTNYVAAAIGEPGVATGPTAFTLAVSGLGREAAVNPARADLLVLHGAPDAPPVDVKVRGGPRLVNDLAYGDYDAGYDTVPPGAYTVDVTLADGITRVRSFTADLSGAAGAALVVAASGFVAPPAGGPDFGLLAVFPNGTTALLPVVAAGVEGTNRSDVFTAREAAPGILRVAGPGGAVRFLAATNPTVTVDGKGGNDLLTAAYGAGLPTLAFNGGAGRDAVLAAGTAGADTITAADTPAGLSLVVNGGTILATGIEALTASGGDGNDVIDASGVTSLPVAVAGGRGNDTIDGGSRDDLIDGGAGDDVIRGNDGNDFLFGGAGNDSLLGGNGDDVLIGLGGTDTADGGAGHDLELP